MIDMIDARGYICPTPVIMVQKEVKASSPAELEVLVDDEAAVENITRFGKSRGYQVSTETLEDDFLIKLIK